MSERKELSVEEVTAMQARRQAGASNVVIAEEFGISPYRVWRVLGPRGKTGPDPNLELRAEVARLHEAGWTNIAIGEKLGITRERVGQLLGPFARPARRGARGYNVQLRPEDMEVLCTIAAAHGYTRGHGPGGRKGSLSGLLAAVADGDLVLHERAQSS